MAEAMNDLSFMVTGAYGKPLPKSMGSPIRLHLPWKYGFKSIKGIVKISFVKERPIGMWEAIQASEYGFWANVNPEVSHPRWSQAMEEVLGTGERVPTQLFNGYGEFVASLYTRPGKRTSLYVRHKKRPDINPVFAVRLPWSGTVPRLRVRKLKPVAEDTRGGSIFRICMPVGGASGRHIAPAH